MNLQTNPQLELAFEYVRNTDKNLFLTGRAGSGKTTFLNGPSDFHRVFLFSGMRGG